MARPIKAGLEYFPFDVGFDTDEKTEAIMSEFGAEGTLVFVYLLAAVYRKGYFLEWNTLTKNSLANRVTGATGQLVESVVERLIDYETFDKKLFETSKVLTSQRIQDTFLEATKRRKVKSELKYLINVDNNPVTSEVNVDNNPGSTDVNDDINPQSKVKERKVKKSNKETGSPSIPYATIIDYLNEKTGKSFKNAAGHQKYIRARWNEGQRLDDFKRVIDIKSAEWLHDDKMVKYLQPSTLFGNRFDSYLNSKSETKPKPVKKPELDEHEKAKKLNRYIWNRYTNDGMTPDQIQQSLAEMSMTVNLDYITDVITKLEARSR